ncbi:hypothetical protein Goshw_025008, partial [Gossypium schwendimanii]|nr:hypothetical protein [Gossypium schwendimanii]
QVEESISSSLNQVLDTNLHNSIGRKRLTADNCALVILQVGLECSVKAPDERLYNSPILGLVGTVVSEPQIQ